MDLQLSSPPLGLTDCLPAWLPKRRAGPSRAKLAGSNEHKYTGIQMQIQATERKKSRTGIEMTAGRKAAQKKKNSSLKKKREKKRKFRSLSQLPPFVFLRSVPAALTRLQKRRAERGRRAFHIIGARASRKCMYVYICVRVCVCVCVLCF